ncbi:phosphatidylserine decarboxylase [Nitrogeniibacter mangrovi]|uniref:Phosphatidylserine decarboxylase proenzyme n=1 Tax=Nitrogeniibacter mangrovi TaxID=2016596 RepID=A0A6C1B128_9RHOO|nr:phosphatidylserine decarboxylase [Nitrogeniibacter mangrovi]QID17302.1 phosphatidylserine decarboxylase [Nitrogeniibacter mangrovi]
MSSRYPHPFIAREGWTFIGLCFGVALLVHGAFGWPFALPLWLLLLFMLQFFRDPERRAPDVPGAVLSPADGRVIAIESVEDPYLKRDALRISVHMNPFNVHSNRSPVDGEVKQQWYTPGRFLHATLDKASDENERNALWIRCADRIDVTCVQIAGVLARRILCSVKPGDVMKRGQRYGFIRFGSRMDIYLPPGSRARVAIGDKVRATASVIAQFDE